MSLNKALKTPKQFIIESNHAVPGITRKANSYLKRLSNIQRKPKA